MHFLCAFSVDDSSSSSPPQEGVGEDERTRLLKSVCMELMKMTSDLEFCLSLIIMHSKMTAVLTELCWIVSTRKHSIGVVN